MCLTINWFRVNKRRNIVQRAKNVRLWCLWWQLNHLTASKLVNWHLTVGPLFFSRFSVSIEFSSEKWLWTVYFDLATEFRALDNAFNTFPQRRHWEWKKVSDKKRDFIPKILVCFLLVTLRLGFALFVLILYLYMFLIGVFISNLFIVCQSIYLKVEWLIYSLNSFLSTVSVEQKGKVLEISADLKPSPREPFLLKEVKAAKQFCPKCTLGLDIKHTDVLILKQYLREDGTMLPRRITGLCPVQQKNIGTMVIMARRAG